ncbi:MAG: hypothetical protein ACLRXQ_02045 [Phascolarctobacterium faecium]
MEQLDQAMRATTLENPYFTAALYENFTDVPTSWPRGLPGGTCLYRTAAPLRVVGDADNYPMEWLTVKTAFIRHLSGCAEIIGSEQRFNDGGLPPDMASSWELLADSGAGVISGIVGRKNWRPNTILLNNFLKKII